MNQQTFAMYKKTVGTFDKITYTCLHHPTECVDNISDCICWVDSNTIRNYWLKELLDIGIDPATIHKKFHIIDWELITTKYHERRLMKNNISYWETKRI
jgi:hypothetical protein